MRRIRIRWRPVYGQRRCGAQERERRGFFKLPIFDVRLLGAIATLIALAKLGNPDPVQERASSLVVRGEHGAQVTSFAFSPTGAHIATTNTAGRITLRSSTGGWQVERILDFPGYARAVAFSADGRSMAAVGIEPGLWLWDLNSSSRKPTTTMALPVKRAMRVMFSPDGQALAATTDLDGTILLWDLAKRRERMILRHPSPVTSIAFSPEGRSLAAGGRDERWIVLWDLQTGSGQMMAEDGVGPTAALAFSPDGAFLASGGHFEHDVRLWRLDSRTGFRVIARHARSVNSIAFSPDGVLLATAGNDGMLGLWTVATGQRRVSLDVHARRLHTVAFSPDGRSVVLATGDDDVHVWHLDELLGASPDGT